MGAGESIENHRVNEVIDHPAGSVPIDKMSFSRVIKTWFESIDGWVNYSFNGGSAQAGLGALYLYTGTSTNGTSCVVAIGSGFIGLNMSKAFYWRSTMIFANISNAFSYWGPAYVVDQADYNGFGFKISGGVLQAFMGDFTNFATINISGINLAETHVFEIRYSVSPQKAEFYIDGNLVAVFDSGNFPENGDEIASYYIRRVSSTGGAISVSDFQYEQER
jgi:hypothetical protein